MQEYLYNLATDKSKGFVAALAKTFLLPFALVYGLAVRTLIFFSRISPFRLPCRVISVGNITLGGTGKTSLVEYIAYYLETQGHKVAVLSRGYGLDEPLLLQQKLPGIPVIVDSNRIRSGLRAIKEYGVDAVILDDGFQQWKIKKDLEIAAIDAGDPFGNGKVLPRGILREPLSSLARAEVFILTKTNLNPDTTGIKERLKKYSPRALILESTHEALGFYNLHKPGECSGQDSLKGRLAALFCGIGAPDSFKKLISSLGIESGLFFKFPDHYRYAQGDIDRIIRAAIAKNIDTIITTEKDAVRLDAIGPIAPAVRILVLRIRLSLKNEEEFQHRLLKLFSL